MSSPGMIKISELSRKTEVPLATIKFYLREGLLPPGQRTGPNQAVYGPAHISRLRLIRTMRDVGGLSITTIREILHAIDDTPGPALLARVTDAIADTPGPAISELLTVGLGRAEAEADIDALIQRLGWRIRPESRTRARLVDAFMALHVTVEPAIPVDILETYARLAFELANHERSVGIRNLEAGLDGVVQGVVAGLILWEMVFSTMRRLAHEHLAGESAYRDWLSAWQSPDAGDSAPGGRDDAP